MAGTSVDELANGLAGVGLRAEALHTYPARLNVWNPANSVWDVHTFTGPFTGSVGDEVTRIAQIVSAGE